MKDLIDVGNRVFDRLILAHGEMPESRTLFLYGITTGTTWTIIDSTKWINIEKTGITKNFEDSEIDQADRDWKFQLESQTQAAAQKIIDKIKPKNDGPRDGDTYEFWRNDGPWREIKF